MISGYVDWRGSAEKNVRSECTQSLHALSLHSFSMKWFSEVATPKN